MNFDSVATSPFAALVLALAIVAGFVSGHIVSGQLYKDLLAALKQLTAALEVRNKIDQESFARRDHS